MKRSARILLALLLLSGVLIGCQRPYAAADVTQIELVEVVETEAIVFQTNELPGEMIARLAEADVVFLGEVHNLQNHAELLASLAVRLQTEGFQQVLLECFHAFDWQVNAYALGENIGLNPYLSQYYGAVLDVIRSHNESLPPAERIQVHAIDINHDLNALVPSLQAYAAWLPDAAELHVLTEELASLSQEEQTILLEQFLAWMEEHAATLQNAWGEGPYRQIETMIDVQLKSIAIKQHWSSDYDDAHREREAVICELVDALLEDVDGSTLINMGFNHAQLLPLRGTDQEWLADYLSHHSAAAGDVFSICATIADGYRLDNEGNPAAFSLMERSKENELMRVLWEVGDGKPVFLPLEDPFFQDRMIPVNYLGDVRTTHPADVYDAFILLTDVHPLESLGIRLP